MEQLKKEAVSITLDPDTIKIIKSLAEQDDRSFSQYINKILNAYIRKINKKNTNNELL